MIRPTSNGSRAGIAPNAANIITVSEIKPEMSERFLPEPGAITVRRSGGGLKPLIVLNS